MKIAINNQYGGFSLSPLATKRLAELRGKECYFFKYDFREGKDRYIPATIDEIENDLMWFAYSVPNPQDYKLDEQDEDGLYRSANERAEKIKIDSRPEKDQRHDPLLIQVIEELGEKANGSCASLKIVEIPDDTDYVIEEYDGNEWVAETHKTWS